MTFRLTDPRTAKRRGAPVSQGDDAQRQAAQPQLLEVLERLYPRPLTERQRRDMAQALDDQLAAAATLRRFALENDDAPCFAPIAQREPGGE